MPSRRLRRRDTPCRYIFPFGCIEVWDSLSTSLLVKLSINLKNALEKTHAQDLPDADAVSSWSVQQVVKYFNSTTDCKSFAQVCEDQEMDGDSLLVLTEDTLVKFGVKMGPAVEIMRHVNALKWKQS